MVQLDRILHYSSLMKRSQIAQATEESIIRNLHINIAHETRDKIMEPSRPSVPEVAEINTIGLLLEPPSRVLVLRKGEIAGMVARVRRVEDSFTMS
jgi:predicted transcriptional regulator